MEGCPMKIKVPAVRGKIQDRMEGGSFGKALASIRT